MIIGFTSTTFRHLPAEEICELGAAAHADWIEWSDLHVPSPGIAADIAGRCDALGIAGRSLGSYYRVGTQDGAHWENLCETASALGAGLIRVWLGERGSARTGEGEYEKLLEDAGGMIQTAANYGLTVAAEAHPNTYNDSLPTSLRFLRDIDSPIFCTYFQSLYLDMTADLERLEQTYPYVRAAHVSFSEVRRNQRFRKKEDGCVERIVHALREKDFGGPVLLEFCERGSAEAFACDMARLREIGNWGLGGLL
ncbi:MAG: sugar phosphate isomerase/epimerase [Oscillospiraceae bacterium]|nr:sugar phosphate isomerase/epimerase [Oscillospiraceae bacterium]